MKPTAPDNNPAEPATSQPRAHSSVTGWNDTDQLSSSKILIVDDNPEHTRIAEVILRGNGFTKIVNAIDHDQILDQLNTTTDSPNPDLDLIIIDMMTLGTQAIKICQQIQSRGVPIMLISPNVEWHEDAMTSGLNAGAQDIMFKPVHQYDFIPRVLTLLKLKRERDINAQRQRTLESELAERKIIEARLQYMANHDDLTGLCNRKRLQQALDVANLQADLNGRQSALVYIDLNQFKVINDLEGHDAGDRLLTTIANILRRHSSASATMSRINSDEYAILFEDCNEKSAYTYTNAIRQDIDNLQFRVDNRKYTVAASYGIVAIKPGVKHTSTDILASADKACYEAKRKGRNNIHIYNKADNNFDTLREDAYWIPRIKEALSGSKLKLLFQPVLDIHTNKIDRFEALLRMVDSNNELVTPDNFIPVAERNGLIQQIDLWVVSRSFDILSTSAKLNRNISFNINLSSHTFHEKKFLPLVINKLKHTQIDPNRITFEITETAAVTSYKKGREVLEKLRELGFMIALDDFGSGFNSFFHLKQLPVDYIKIDGGFITNLTTDSVDQTLVKSITEISRKLGKKTVAEFVVNRETLDLLKSYGVDYAQGFYIGKPGEINTFNAA